MSAEASTDDGQIICLCPICGHSASSLSDLNKHMDASHHHSQQQDERPLALEAVTSTTSHLSSSCSPPPPPPLNWHHHRLVIAEEPTPTAHSTPCSSSTSQKTRRRRRRRLCQQPTSSTRPSTEFKQRRVKSTTLNSEDVVGRPTTMTTNDDHQVDSRRRYRCNSCSETFPWHGDLTDHLRRFHNIERPRESSRSGRAGSFNCPHCKYIAKYKSELRRHMRLHYGVKPFTCIFCDYRSAWKGDLKRHMDAHHRELFTSEAELNGIMAQFKNNAGTIAGLTRPATEAVGGTSPDSSSTSVVVAKNVNGNQTNCDLYTFKCETSTSPRPYIIDGGIHKDSLELLTEQQRRLLTTVHAQSLYNVRQRDEISSSPAPNGGRVKELHNTAVTSSSCSQNYHHYLPQLNPASLTTADDVGSTKLLDEESNTKYWIHSPPPPMSCNNGGQEQTINTPSPPCHRSSSTTSSSPPELIQSTLSLLTPNCQLPDALSQPVTSRDATSVSLNYDHLDHLASPIDLSFKNERGHPLSDQFNSNDDSQQPLDLVATPLLLGGRRDADSQNGVDVVELGGRSNVNSGALPTALFHQGNGAFYQQTTQQPHLSHPIANPSFMQNNHTTVSTSMNEQPVYYPNNNWLQNMLAFLMKKQSLNQKDFLTSQTSSQNIYTNLTQFPLLSPINFTSKMPIDNTSTLLSNLKSHNALSERISSSLNSSESKETGTNLLSESSMSTINNDPLLGRRRSSKSPPTHPVLEQYLEQKESSSQETTTEHLMNSSTTFCVEKAPTIDRRSTNTENAKKRWNQYQCSDCGYLSNWKWDMAKHIKATHPETRSCIITLNCIESEPTLDYCVTQSRNDRFSSSSLMSTGSPEAIDDSSTSRFKKHITSYYRPYQCNTCGYRSNWKWDVSKHIKQLHYGKAELIMLANNAAKQSRHFTRKKGRCLTTSQSSRRQSLAVVCSSPPSIEPLGDCQLSTASKSSQLVNNSDSSNQSATTTIRSIHRRSYHCRRCFNRVHSQAKLKSHYRLRSCSDVARISRKSTLVTLPKGDLHETPGTGHLNYHRCGDSQQHRQADNEESSRVDDVNVLLHHKGENRLVGEQHLIDLLDQVLLALLPPTLSPGEASSPSSSSKENSTIDYCPANASKHHSTAVSSESPSRLYSSYLIQLPSVKERLNKLMQIHSQSVQTETYTMSGG